MPALENAKGTPVVPKRKAAPKPKRPAKRAGKVVQTTPHVYTISTSSDSVTVPAAALVAHDVSQKGLDFIASFEGCVLHPYDDGGRPGHGNATVGVGHLLHLGPSTDTDRKKYACFTRAQALTLLKVDAGKAVAAVRSLGVKLNQHEFDALVSFAFNCGGGALTGGIAHHLHAGDKRGAMNVLREYTHAGPQILQGLVRRRNAEAHLFLTGAYA